MYNYLLVTRFAMRASLSLALLASAPVLVAAQSTCSSDGQPSAVAVYERFINADCDTCWVSAPSHVPGPSALVVDWVVPGRLGDDAPLSAAATRDALTRLQELNRPIPEQTDSHIADIGRPTAASAQLRVAEGPAFNDYLGTGIRFTHRGSGAASYQFTMLLVESIPAGEEGSPVPRNLVRNSLQGTWLKDDGRTNTSKAWMENRPMRIPDGAQAERLRLVGWVQDPTGRLVAAAQSVCR
ncbi:MAG: hypothetical protein ACK4OE_04700 [Acidovorax sp.]|uniref:hypothetical protein n=1 Tax=Acidovorax sp. TaxID=1872122 RepID=UPI003918B09D